MLYIIKNTINNNFSYTNRICNKLKNNCYRLFCSETIENHVDVKFSNG